MGTRVRRARALMDAYGWSCARALAYAVLVERREGMGFGRATAEAYAARYHRAYAEELVAAREVLRASPVAYRWTFGRPGIGR